MTRPKMPQVWAKVECLESWGSDLPDANRFEHFE
jgi:hypothetical protein